MEDRVTVQDSNNREIQIRKLGALDRMRLFEVLGGPLSENVLYLGYALSAASVTKLENDDVAFPATKKAVELMVHRLGDEGLEAITRAYRENFTIGETGDLDVVKN